MVNEVTRYETSPIDRPTPRLGLKFTQLYTSLLTAVSEYSKRVKQKQHTKLAVRLRCTDTSPICKCRSSSERSMADSRHDVCQILSSAVIWKCFLAFR